MNENILKLFNKIIIVENEDLFTREIVSANQSKHILIF